MRTTAFLAIALAGLALSACTDRYYDDRYGYGNRYGYDDRYYGPPPAYDRDRYYDRHDANRYDDMHNDRY